MRNLISTCAVAFAIVCATQSIHAAEPAAAPAQPAPSASPAPAVDAAPAEPAAAAEPATEQDTTSPEFQRVAKQYRQVEKEGQLLYCRNEKRLGTRLAAPVCLTEAQLWERVHKAEDVRDNMRTPRTGVCGSGVLGC